MAVVVANAVPALGETTDTLSESVQDAVVPSVVTIFPLFPVCAGKALEKPVAATKAVVAICVVLVPADAVGAVGVPVNAGDSSGAFRSS